MILLFYTQILTPLRHVFVNSWNRSGKGRPRIDVDLRAYPTVSRKVSYLCTRVINPSTLSSFFKKSVLNVCQFTGSEYTCRIRV